MGKRKQLERFRLESGYLMLSTLFLLVLTGIFLQGIIQISANHIIQLNQISSTYEAKTALNMSEKILKDYITENNEQPGKANLSSSAGNIEIIRNTHNNYDAIITQINGMQFRKHIKIDVFENTEEIHDPAEVLKLPN